MIVTGKRVFLCGVLGISLLCSSISFSRDFGAGLAVGGLTGLVGATVLSKAAAHTSDGYSHRDIRKMEKKIDHLEDLLESRDREIETLRTQLAKYRLDK